VEDRRMEEMVKGITKGMTSDAVEKLLSPKSGISEYRAFQ
jgi:hypothetical protein